MFSDNHNQGHGFFNHGHNNQSKGQDENQQRQKPKVFVPVTLKMVEEATPRPDDVCEIDGEAFNDIILVGRLITQTHEALRTTFEINDNKGVTKVIFY